MKTASYTPATTNAATPGNSNATATAASSPRTFREHDADIDEALKQKLKDLEKIPDGASKILTGKFRILTAQHKNLIKSATSYLVTIIPYIHLSRKLKTTLRHFLGLKFPYTQNLAWAEQWSALLRGCRLHLNHLGQQLDTFYKEQALFARLGMYQPSIDITAPELRRQYVPEECAAHTFGDNGKNICADHNRESTYIHFLRLLGLAFDSSFQRTVKERLTTAGIGNFQVTSGGVKSYERMHLKVLSRQDHRHCPKPRPAQNMDIVRCIVIFSDVEDMKRGCEVCATSTICCIVVVSFINCFLVLGFLLHRSWNHYMMVVTSSSRMEWRGTVPMLKLASTSVCFLVLGGSQTRSSVQWDSYVETLSFNMPGTTISIHRSSLPSCHGTHGSIKSLKLKGG